MTAAAEGLFVRGEHGAEAGLFMSARKFLGLSS
jgi:hypothetical protein